MHPQRKAALAAYFALIALVFAWEAWLAPPTPVARAFWLALKILPLALAFPWLMRGSAHAYVLTAILMLLYFSDGIAGIYGAARGESWAVLAYAAAQSALSLSFIVAASLYARFRLRNPSVPTRGETGS